MFRFLVGMICLSVALTASAQDGGKYEGKTLKEWIAQLKDKDAYERQNAAHAIGQMKFQAKEVVPALAEALKTDKDALVRGEVADTLGRLGYSARDAMPALLETVKKDKDVGVRAAAVLAVGSIGATNK